MASPEIKNLARCLVAFEAGRKTAPETGEDDAERVIAELRFRLIKLAGVDGFCSLLNRALTLARAETPALESLQVSADGTLVARDSANATRLMENMGQGGVVLVAHLLELLVTFIGESLTLHLVRDAWPEASMTGASMNGVDLNTEETS